MRRLLALPAGEVRRLLILCRSLGRFFLTRLGDLLLPGKDRVDYVVTAAQLDKYLPAFKESRRQAKTMTNILFSKTHVQNLLTPGAIFKKAHLRDCCCC